MAALIRTVWNNWFRSPPSPVRQRAPSARWHAGSAAPPRDTVPMPVRAHGAAVPPVSIRQPSARWGTRRQPHPAPAASVRVEEIVEETPSTRTIVFAPAGDALSSLHAGQHLTFEVPIDGVTYRRCYSLSSPPGAVRPAITVRRVEGGTVSNHLCGRLRVGETLRAHGPSGEFAVVPDAARATHYVMVAGGVGITPLISMLETVLAHEPKSRVTLLYGSRSEDDIIFHERIARLAGAHPDRLQVVLALDQARARWPGIKGPLTGERVLAALGTDTDDAEFYVCGPAAMMDSVVSALAGAGVSRERIHLERFAYADARTVEHPEQAFAVRFAASGRTLQSRPREPLLQTALEAGVDLAYSCQMGGCGQCRVKTAGGSVVMDQPNCLSPAEVEAGYILTCCAYPASDLVIAER